MMYVLMVNDNIKYSWNIVALGLPYARTWDVGVVLACIVGNPRMSQGQTVLGCRSVEGHPGMS